MFATHFLEGMGPSFERCMERNIKENIYNLSLLSTKK